MTHNELVAVVERLRKQIGEICEELHTVCEALAQERHEEYDKVYIFNKAEQERVKRELEIQRQEAERINEEERSDKLKEDADYIAMSMIARYGSLNRARDVAEGHADQALKVGYTEAHDIWGAVVDAIDAAKSAKAEQAR